jgi:hypothetical protein
MKRNWETIRELLSRIEENTLPSDILRLSNFPAERHAEVSYHMNLLLDAGLVEGEMSKTLSPGPWNFIASRLTWAGHEFLDSIRSETVWQRTKKVFTEHGISMTFDLVRTVAKDAAETLIRSTLG